MKIQLYGQPTWNYEFLKMHLLNLTNKSGVNLDIEEVNHWSKILEECVETIPAVKINDEEYLAKEKNESLNQYVKKVFSSILQKENYGNMPVLIVPVDFSETSKNAMLYAIQLAEKINGVVKVVHVYHPNSECENIRGTSKTWEKRNELKVFIEHDTSHWLNENIESPIIEDHFYIGLPIRTIVEISNQFNNSMIIMGTKGEGDSMKKRFGSVSTEVAAKAACPVLLVPPGTTEFSFDHICYALDDLKTDGLAKGFLAAFARKTKSIISLAHISEENNAYNWSDLMQYWKLSYPKNKLGLYQYERKNITGGLQEFCKSNVVDLLVMSVRKRSFFNSIFHHSNTQESAIYTKLPLLILHAE